MRPATKTAAPSPRSFSTASAAAQSSQSVSKAYPTHIEKVEAAAGSLDPDPPPEQRLRAPAGVEAPPATIVALEDQETTLPK
jgi:hypothetical protein